MKQQPDPAARPAVFVLFGATGDLAKRMVLPALYRLACSGLLPRQWLLVGNGRGDITHENFRAHVHDALTERRAVARLGGRPALSPAAADPEPPCAAGLPTPMAQVISEPSVTGNE